jgi:cobalamin biosynthesis Mg chelatase CobN
LSETQQDETQPSDFANALDSMMDNVENVVVNFQKTLLVMLEKIEKLESLEKPSIDDRAPNEKGSNTEEIKQSTNDATNSAEKTHQESNETHSETEMTTNTGVNLQQSENEIQESEHTAGVRGIDISKGSNLAGTFTQIFKKASSKPKYCILAIALAVLSVAIVKLYFMLFP